MKYLFCDRCGKKREVDENGFPEEHFVEKERLTILNIYGDRAKDEYWERHRDLCSTCLNELRSLQKKHDLEVISWYRKTE